MKTALLVFIFSGVSLVWGAGKDTGAPFTLAVVPSWSSSQSRSIAIADDKPDEFYVVLTNTSKDPQAVFEYWNSWGYQSIAFEFTTQEGKKVALSMRPQDFSRNFPSTFLIQPGEHQVYAIRLDKRWECRPRLVAETGMQITLKAIYQVSATPEATQHKVWTGQVESKPYNLTLRHWETPK